MDGSNFRIEAERWLTIAEKLVTARDFQGAKTFAIRARESDPRLLEFADQIIAVADTILAGELRILSYPGGGSLDYYAILQLPRLSQSMDLIATQYRKLALLLNPTRNRLSFADHAFTLVSEAWMVFSNPAKKAMYDHELQVSQLGQLGQIGQFGQMGVPGQDYAQGQPSQGNERRSPRYSRDGGFAVEEDRVAQPAPTFFNRIQSSVKVTEPIRPVAQHKAAEPFRPVAQTRSPDPVRSQPQTKPTEPVRPNPTESNARPTGSANVPIAVPSFWTACPYCFILYEYPQGYEDCAIRCQKCKRAFHATTIPTPPITGKDTYFCSWSYFPLGFSGHGKGGGGSGTNWSPISAMYAAPLPGGWKPKKISQPKRPAGKVIYDDEVYVDLSDLSGDEESDSDDDWDDRDNRRKKVKNAKGNSTPSSNNNKRSQTERSKKLNLQNGAGEAIEKGEGSSAKKRGKLDLNVMFSNEVDDSVPGVSQRNGPGNGEEDNIGFFEGLDEFLSSLPILSVVGDDKVKAS